MRPTDIGAIPLGLAVNIHKGTAAKYLARPDNDTQVLVVMASVGNFNLRNGDFESAGMPSTESPAASVTDGTAGFPVAEGSMFVTAVGEGVTIKGYDAASLLVYWWV